MNTSEENSKVKIRIKFKSGEEFEAEGSADFIEKQRAEFLQLIGKDSRRAGRQIAPHAADSISYTEKPGTPITVPTEEIQLADAFLPNPTHAGEKPTPLSVGGDSAPSYESDEQLHMPAVLRTSSSLENRGGTSQTRQTPPISTDTTAFAAYPAPAWPTINKPQNPTISQGISAMERASLRSEKKGGNPSAADTRLWEEIVRVEEEKVFLRRKSRLLTADTAALILLAAAKILLNLPDGYSALALAKSLKKSGYGGGRLDRVLGGELRRGTVRSEGYKRARFYFLSDEGFAKAYVLAGKLVEERR